jgi:hypothetical protein
MNVKAVQSFLGFANFYRRFTGGFSKVCKPLTDLSKKGTWCQWREEVKGTFEILKSRFTTVPILRQLAKAKTECLQPGVTRFTDGSRLDSRAVGYAVVWKKGQS